MPGSWAVLRDASPFAKIKVPSAILLCVCGPGRLRQCQLVHLSSLVGCIGAFMIIALGTRSHRAWLRHDCMYGRARRRSRAALRARGDSRVSCALKSHFTPPTRHDVKRRSSPVCGFHKTQHEFVCVRHVTRSFQGFSPSVSARGSAIRNRNLR